MKQICFSLLNAKSEEEVEEIIRNNRTFFAQENWKPFPDGSFGTIESQGRDPHRAIVEKLTNAIDAILLRECLKRKINPESKEAPQSINEALKLFFDIDDGDIVGLPKDKIDRLASQIYLVAENLRDKKASIYIVDKGEGQEPANFKNTFLKFGGNKVKVFFVHGRFGTGSFGVLPNSGDKGFQLVLSKKYSDNKSGDWGWTLIRKNMGEDVQAKSAWYEYVTDNGEIPTFQEDDLSKVIKTVVGYERLDMDEYTSGTLIKVYDYDLVTTTDIDRDLSRILNRYLFAPALPYRILNAQTKSNVGPGKEQYGNVNRLKKNKKELIDETKITIQKVKLGVLGLVDIDIYNGKKSEDKKSSFIDSEKISTTKESVFFLRNGQTHGELDRSFLKNDVGLSYIANDMAVYIDCSDTTPSYFDAVFSPTRDTMRSNHYQEEVRADLEYELKNHEGLKKINTSRKNQIIVQEVKKSEDLEMFVNDLMEYDPTLKMLLSGSFPITLTSKRGNSEDKFKGNYYPSFLNIKDSEIKSKGFKNLPINSYVNVILETDVENNYFVREDNPGQINVIFNGETRSIKLYEGRITIRFLPGVDAKVGDESNVLVELVRPFKENLTVDFKIKISDPIVKQVNPPPPPPPPKGSILNLPKLHSLTEAEWENAGYEKDNLIDLDVERSSDSANHVLKVVKVNTDFPFLNLYLQNQRFSGSQVDVMKKQYVNAVYIASLAVHRNFAKEGSYPSEKINQIINNIGYCLPYSLFTMQKKIIKELES